MNNVNVSQCVFFIIKCAYVLSHSLQRHGLQPTRLLCPWNFWSGLPFPTPRNLCNAEIEPMFLVSLALLAGGFFTTASQNNAIYDIFELCNEKLFIIKKKIFGIAPAGEKLGYRDLSIETELTGFSSQLDLYGFALRAPVPAPLGSSFLASFLHVTFLVRTSHRRKWSIE